MKLVRALSDANVLLLLALPTHSDVAASVERSPIWAPWRICRAWQSGGLRLGSSLPAPIQVEYSFYYGSTFNDMYFG